ncbi:MAG: hypothetical protein N3D20_01235 [Candidatus Pacearchaeota archaeon]|nr:hypothetical protein [Candidatus Pacearchaeota archaeon]
MVAEDNKKSLIETLNAFGIDSTIQIINNRARGNKINEMQIMIEFVDRGLENWVINKGVWV